MAITKLDFTRIWAVSAPGSEIIDPDSESPGKFAQGWVEEIPPHEYFNFIQNWATKGLAYFNEQGVAEWDANTVYPVDAYTKGSNGQLYIAQQEQAGNDPVGDGGTNWEPFSASLDNLANNTFLQGYESDDTTLRNLIGVDDSENVDIDGGKIVIPDAIAAGALTLADHTGNTYRSSAVVKDGQGDLNGVGSNVIRMRIPGSDGENITSADNGRAIRRAGSTVNTLNLTNSGSWPTGGIVTVINVGSGDLTVNQTGGDLFQILDGAGGTTPGAATIAAGGIATFNAFSGTWFVTGAGVS